MNTPQALTLSQYTRRIAKQIMGAPDLQNVWVTGQVSDLKVAGGHCYMELVEKDDAKGQPIAKIRATIWASTFYKLQVKFMQQTGQQLCSDIKVMVQVSANFHPVFGLSANIIDIDGAYTLGDVMQRRNEILRQLQNDGVLQMNRQLLWPMVPHRIAIISAPNAAGYGDFINQLYNNKHRLRFTTKLFAATMQGERTVPSIIQALDRICEEMDDWDCVVIIRGGGASTDLLAFDNYDLARHVAEYPLPVVIGIGHERDITVLDYVANMRVKTPTAAAEWLIQCGANMLGYLQGKASEILQTVTDKLGGCHRQLAYMSGQLPAAVTMALTRAARKLDNACATMRSVADRHLRPQHVRLDAYMRSLAQAIDSTINRERCKLDADEKLLKVLSPEATLSRGYSITRVAGHAVSSSEEIRQGEIIETILAHGSIFSTAIYSAPPESQQ